MDLVDPHRLLTWVWSTPKQAIPLIELDKPWPVDEELPEGAVLMNADRTYIAITSETGVTQGDALAMILFTICLQRVLDVVAAAFPRIDIIT